MSNGSETAQTHPADDAVDVLIIGGGPGGTPAAMALAQAGRRVMLVEAGPGLGGTCLFSGCIPSKIFRETAFRRWEAARASEFGLGSPSGEPPAVNWDVVQRRRHQILAQRSGGALTKARSLPSLEVVFGRARLTGPRTARIERVGAPGCSVRFERAILATGSMPSPLPIPGVDLPGVLDSDRLIGIGFVPESLVLIGGGPIGIEMAQIFGMLGARVSVLEAAPRILGPVDGVLAKLLSDQLVATGIRLETGVSVDRIDGSEGAHRVHFSRAGSPDVIEAQVVAIVAGRHPNVVGLGLETTGVRHGPHGVIVNAELETDEPGIFATGDLVGHPMFAHWATAQALAVARHILGMPAAFPRPEHNSAVIFSRPEIGMAGLTEEEAKARGLDVAAAEYDYRIDARAQIAGEVLGRLRLIYRRDDHRIVGVHVLAEGAADVTGEAALVVRNGLTLEQLAASIHPHPTLTEAFGLAAQSAIAGQRREPG
ncbi:dihydrolipoyl dehydrogenase family protein [Solirhodobacter olei]|uniref:dihydrolipoyl dehydrogenase family protein n=1 Tax=Solirhodobacter olei TaxID=2493082 RepID=UPI000FD9D5E2|nr:NAD(P)/FAD-dependent oxidoreductase [Solirhodobacter olei]